MRGVEGRGGQSRRYCVDLARRDAGGDNSSRLLEWGAGHRRGSGSEGGTTTSSDAADIGAGRHTDEVGMGEDLIFRAADGLGGDAGEPPAEQLPDEGRELGPLEKEGEDQLAKERLIEDDNGLAVVAPRGGALVWGILASLGGGIVHHQAEDVGKAAIGLIVKRVFLGRFRPLGDRRRR